jgi:Acyl-coenzyme A:6-aminopenicillanic acid acyl-transferase
MCFLIGATGKGFSKNGDALLGSVSDDPYDVRTFMKRVKPSGCLAHLGTELISTTTKTLKDRGYFANSGETTRGINEAGLAFTCALIIEDETIPKELEAAPFVDLTTYLMNHCNSVQEGLELFASKAAIAPAYSVLLADAKGDLAHIEVGSFGIAVHDHYTSAKPGMVFAVNCYLSQKLAKFNAPNALISNKKNNNQARRERGKELIAQLQREIDVETLEKVLSDHQNRDRDPTENPILPGWGYSICNHGTLKEANMEDLPWGTVSAEILQPSKKQFWYAYGWPCGGKPEYRDQLYQDHSWGKFVPFSFDAIQTDQETTPLTTPYGDII